LITATNSCIQHIWRVEIKEGFGAIESGYDGMPITLFYLNALESPVDLWKPFKSGLPASHGRGHSPARIINAITPIIAEASI
jgi:hypothetical protein